MNKPIVTYRPVWLAFAASGCTVVALILEFLTHIVPLMAAVLIIALMLMIAAWVTAVRERKAVLRWREENMP